MLDNAGLKDLLGKMMTPPLSFGILGAGRTNARYGSWCGNGTTFRMWRYIRLLRQGVTINRKKTQGLYAEERLSVRKCKS